MWARIVHLIAASVIVMGYGLELRGDTKSHGEEHASAAGFVSVVEYPGPVLSWPDGAYPTWSRSAGSGMCRPSAESN